MPFLFSAELKTFAYFGRSTSNEHFCTSYNLTVTAKLTSHLFYIVEYQEKCMLRVCLPSIPLSSKYNVITSLCFH